MLQIIESVIPVFLVIGVGYILRTGRWLPEGSPSGLSWFIFHVSVPALLFRNISKTDVTAVLDFSPVLTVMVVSVGLSISALIITSKILPQRRGVISQGTYRSNMVFVGLPVLQNILGSESELMGIVSVIIGFTIPVYNFLAVIILYYPLRKNRSNSNVRSRFIQDILMNPLILSSLAGLFVSAIGGTYPNFVDRTLEMLGRLAAPLALVSVGLSLDIFRAKGEFFTALIVSICKLILYPGLVYGGLVFLEVPEEIVFSVVILMSAPTAVASHIMAREMGGDEELSASIVVVSTLFSIITMTGWLVYFHL